MRSRRSIAASPEALKSALSSPTDVGGVATLLSDLAPVDVDLSSVDPFVEAMARGAAIKQELLTSGVGDLTSSQVTSALGITRQAVDKRRIRRALLAVPNGSGECLYPACQFTSRALWEHSDQPDGILYRSRHDDSALRVALDRVNDALPIVQDCSLAEDSKQLAKLLRRYGLALTN